MLLHVLGHIDTNHIIFTIEQALGQGLGKLSLAHSRRSEKEKGTNRAMGILDTCPCSHDRFRYCIYRLVLANHPFMQNTLQTQ